MRMAALACLVALASIAAGCGTASSHASATRSIVALGDSVPAGANCHCRPFPELSADGLAAAGSHAVTATNDAVGGYTTTSVLHQLGTDDAVIDHVRGADIVEIEIGANDV